MPRPAPRSRDELQIVQLEPDTLEFVRAWVSVSTAARILGVSREGLYQSTRDGSVRFGYRWMFRSAYNSWIRNQHA